MAYKTIEPSLIANTIMRKYIDGNGVFIAYRIEPIEGYVLHRKNLDFYKGYDDEGNPIGDLILGYQASEMSCGANYNFNDTKIIDGYTAHGTFEFFARPESEVESNQSKKN